MQSLTFLDRNRKKAFCVPNHLKRLYRFGYRVVCISQHTRLDLFCKCRREVN